MAARERLPTTSGRRRATSALRAHWRRLAGVLLLGVGAPISVAGGWASKNDRLWWLLAAGACATGAGVLQLNPTHPHPVSPAGTKGESGSKTPDKPRLWNIPPPVRTFIGRDLQLAAIREQLAAGEAVALLPAAALHGMGGIGKTQLARAYAHRYADHYQLGWWVPAETDLTITAALTQLAAALGLPAELPPAQLVVRLYQLLAEQDGWLLVFDNAEQPAVVEPFVPKAGRGHVLLTSRNPAWRGIADPIPIDLLPLPAAVRLLQQRTGDPDRHAAQTLAEELGRLPLALEQAGAFIDAQRLSLARYLKLYQQRRAELLSRGLPIGYPDTVDATLTIALDRLREQHPAAVQLLELCAVLAPDQLPARMLLSEPGGLPEPLAAAARDPLRADETVGALYQVSLLTADVGDTARLHRLVQAVTRQHLSGPDWDARVDQAVQLVASLFPREGWEPSQWPRCSLLLAHAETALGHAEQCQRSTPAAGVLLSNVGVYLRARGLHRRARPLDERALAIRRQLYDGDHAEIAESLFHLSWDLSHAGEFQGAREVSGQALAMHRRLHAGDHPDVAWSLHRFATTLRGLGEVERARDLHEEALAMRQRLYAGDHRDITASLQMLGIDLRELGEVERARELHEQALAMHQRLYGHDTDVVDVAEDLLQLGMDLRELGEVERARELHEQALAMGRRIRGGDHLEIALYLEQLAVDLAALGEVARARELDAEAAAMRARDPRRGYLLGGSELGGGRSRREGS
jgi:tetratricopeptide (TPR) repeat protein